MHSVHREKTVGCGGRDCRVEQVEAPELKPNGRRRGSPNLGWRIRTRRSPEGEGKEEGAVAGNTRGLELGGEALAGRKLSRGYNAGSTV